MSTALKDITGLVPSVHGASTDSSWQGRLHSATRLTKLYFHTKEADHEKRYRRRSESTEVYQPDRGHCIRPRIYTYVPDRGHQDRLGLPGLFLRGDCPSTRCISEVAIRYMIQAVDIFLIGLVLMIFIRRIESDSDGANTWVKVTSISQLKRILIELVVVILFVRTLEGILIIEPGDYTWENPVLPLGILMLALALKFMNPGNTINGSPCTLAGQP
ncbi:MAG: YqhA family protein [Thiohalobacterales bacterium]